MTNIEKSGNVHLEKMRKPKLHTPLDLLDNMSNFGPAIGFFTESLDAVDIK